MHNQKSIRKINQSLIDYQESGGGGGGGHTHTSHTQTRHTPDVCVHSDHLDMVVYKR